MAQTLIAVLLVVCIGFPLLYAWRIWRLDEPSRLRWLLFIADAAVFVALVAIVGRWDIAGYYTMWAVMAVFALAVIGSLVRHWPKPWRAEGGPRRWPIAMSLAVFGAALAYVIWGMFPAQQPRELAFPLKNGHFVAAQAGGVTLLNYHASHKAQRYAADITALNAYGFRASGILPTELESYAIFGADVVSPCTGRVVSTRNDLPDLTPPQADPDNAAGNHVVIYCGGFNVEIAHLRQGSVAVQAETRVAIGDAIGKVGNSGNTSEPHLHIHAVDPQTGLGIPMSFDSRAPVRNRLYAR